MLVGGDAVGLALAATAVGDGVASIPLGSSAVEVGEAVDDGVGDGDDDAAPTLPAGRGEALLSGMGAARERLSSSPVPKPTLPPMSRKTASPAKTATSRAIPKAMKDRRSLTTQLQLRARSNDDSTSVERSH